MLDNTSFKFILGFLGIVALAFIILIAVNGYMSIKEESRQAGPPPHMVPVDSNK